MKLFTQFLRPLGLFFIMFLTVLLIIGSLLQVKETSELGNYFEYTTSIENRFYDARMRNQLDPKFVGQEMVLLKIDDYSLQNIGVWPIPRTEHARMVDKLRVFGAKVISFDIMYPERSPNMGDLSPDDVLAQAIKKFQQSGRRAFMAYTITDTQREQDMLPEAPVEMLNDAIQIRTASDANLKPLKISRYTFPIEKFVETEVGLGTITMVVDKDGLFRRYHLVSNVDTIYYGSLALNTYEAFTENKITLDIFSDGSGEIKTAGNKLNISHQGETNIRWVGGEENFPSVSLYDLLQAGDDDEKMKEILDGKIVFIGSTAVGAHDLRPSPIDPYMPGVLAHMNMVHMLLHEYFYQNPDDSVKYSIVYLALGILIFLGVQRLGNAFLDALVIAAIVAFGYYADKYYFLPAGYELKLFYCFFCFTASYSWNTFFLFYQANKEKKQIRGTFARYVAPTIVDEMLKDPDKLQVGGTKMDITCLFSDVRDFTTISESLSALELSQSLNTYMGKMTDIVFDTKGTLDKYIGDAIVAFWGAPLPIGNHAQFAVEGAIKMMEALPAVNEEFKRLGRPEFKVGIGLNSGECSVGNMGSDRIFSYTALGDNMNLGARLESLCKHYGAHILISEFTLARLDLRSIKIRPIDKVIVKGKTTAVKIYEVLHGHHPFYQNNDSLEKFLTAHSLFQQQDFTAALEIFSQLVMIYEYDKPCKRFKDVCQKYVDHPAEITAQFDITTMKEK